jgi:pyroglutamyl-peptidase
MKALITGFDPFNGESINPAFQAIKGMPNNIADCQIIKLEIPTVFNKSIDILKNAINDHNPDIVICVGQAGGRFDITPEYVAINLDEARIPDNEGNKPSGSSIIESGNNAYFTSLPVKAIIKELKSNNIPAKISYTAGTFVCNHLFYGLMHMIQNNHPTIKGGFLHVPYLPEQVVDKNNQPYMSLDMITEGLTLALKSTIEHEEDIELSSGIEH